MTRQTKREFLILRVIVKSTSTVRALTHDAFAKVTSEINPAVDSLFRGMLFQPGG